MKKFILVLIFCTLIFPAKADIFSATNTNKYPNLFAKTENAKLFEMLNFSEMQIFKRTYQKENLSDRLERLELEVYGALQNGDEITRIYKLKKDVTGVALGGNGLNYQTKTMNDKFEMFNLGGGSFGSGSFNISRDTPYTSFRNYYHNNSHRLPPKHHCSHRLPQPENYSTNSNNFSNKNIYKNYSIGTGVKILND